MGQASKQCLEVACAGEDTTEVQRGRAQAFEQGSEETEDVKRGKRKRLN